MESSCKSSSSSLNLLLCEANGIEGRSLNPLHAAIMQKAVLDDVQEISDDSEIIAQFEREIPT